MPSQTHCATHVVISALYINRCGVCSAAVVAHHALFATTYYITGGCQNTDYCGVSHILILIQYLMLIGTIFGWLYTSRAALCSTVLFVVI